MGVQRSLPGGCPGGQAAASRVASSFGLSSPYKRQGRGGPARAPTARGGKVSQVVPAGKAITRARDSPRVGNAGPVPEGQAIHSEGGSEIKGPGAHPSARRLESGLLEETGDRERHGAPSPRATAAGLHEERSLSQALPMTSRARKEPHPHSGFRTLAPSCSDYLFHLEPLAFLDALADRAHALVAMEQAARLAELLAF